MRRAAETIKKIGLIRRMIRSISLNKTWIGLRWSSET